MENNQNKKSTRSSSVSLISAVIAVVCIVIYLSAIIQATVRIYLSIENCKITAEQEFSHLADIALNAGMQDFMGPSFITTINSAIGISNRIEAVIIKTPDVEYAFEKQKGNAVTWVNNSPRFINKFSFSNQEYYRPLPINNLQGINIRAVANAFDYSSFTAILKHTLFIIMIGFALSFFTMLLQLLLGKQETESLSTQSGRQREENSNYSTDNDSDSINTSTRANGLYSPRSGIGWEEYIKDRLDSELHRCSSTEKDLTLVLVEFTDLTNDDMLKQSAEEAVSDLSSRDLLFDYGRWGIAAILPGKNLEEGIKKSENYFKQIMERFPRGYNSKSAVFIGLTSRSGRLLNAGRLILEAKEALKKAKADPASPLIAFKSDPEKYREFIRKTT
ncbi:MAG: hypothetical protein FWB73_02815 [Treponema sp.]|nr:hypothetical protein [Treponema sp.]